MPENLEIETKSMLTKEDYKSLISAYKKVKSYKQTNYYILSAEMFLKLKNYGLRIREKGHKYELTLKVTEQVGKREINQEIDKKSLANLNYFGLFPTGEIQDYLVKNKVCDISNLRIVGKLVTIRKDIQYCDSLISIDKSKYNKIIDYEIECESSSKELAQKDLSTFLQQHNISYQKSEHSKLARFISSIR